MAKTKTKKKKAKAKPKKADAWRAKAPKTGKKRPTPSKKLPAPPVAAWKERATKAQPDVRYEAAKAEWEQAKADLRTAQDELPARSAPTPEIVRLQKAVGTAWTEWNKLSQAHKRATE